MIITQLRFKWTDNSTLSQWFIDGERLYWSEIYQKMMPIYTLEDKDRDLFDYMTEKEILKVKVEKQTAIPYGRYPIDITFSERFQREMPLIRNVKGFSGIRAHNGSFIGDTDGCPLVGYEWHLLVPENNYMVSKSRDCFKEIFPSMSFAISKGPSYIEIVK